jgi:hypothetical protein
MSEEQLRNEVQRLRGELKSERSGHSRRVVLRSAAAIAADPEGVYPVSSEDPFKKIRADRIRYISRSSQPSAPSSGRVISYVDDGDLL